jgi:hypothetical protein
MDEYMSKFERACTVYLRPASSQINSSKFLAIRGYYQCQHTPGLWCHLWHDITFCLVVGNFGIKMTSMATMKHLVTSLEEHYSITVNWTGSLFYIVKLAWDYMTQMVYLYMPNYINKALLKYQHPPQSKPQHARYCPNPIWGTSANSYNRHYSPTLQRTNQVCARHCWHTLLLRTCSGPHNSPWHQSNGFAKSTGHGSHGWHMSSTSRLHRDTS